jgi:hypothetical protein
MRDKSLITRYALDGDSETGVILIFASFDDIHDYG